MKKSRPIDTQKMFFVPLVVLFLIIVIIGFITFSFTAKKFKDKMIESGSTLAETISQSICDSLDYKDSFLGYLDEKLISVGNHLFEERDSFTNEYLFDTAVTFTLTDIYWYNPEGEILYDANDEYVGWTANVGDPIYTFMHSGLDIYVEDIRKGTDDDRYYKFVYMRDEDGYFLQLGIKADNIYEITAQYEYQTVIESFVDNNTELLYALVIDTNYVSVADTDTEEIGVDYSGDNAYELAFLGETNGSDWYYAEIGETVLEIATPIYHDGELIGVLGIGYSYAEYISVRTFLIVIFLVLIVLIIILYTIIQYVGVISSLNKFSAKIESVDLNNIHKISSTEHKGVLKGINNIFTNLINDVYDNRVENQKILNQMTKLAYTDQLSDLPNRNATIDMLCEMCKNNKYIAVIYLDVDDFKSINDTKGHYFGDLLIKEIASTLNQMSMDNVYISRYQGDEFLILYVFQNESDIEILINDIKKRFEIELLIEDTSINVEFSMGISICPRDGRQPEDLLHKADIAMYEAKKSDKMTHKYYDNEMSKLLDRKNLVLMQLNQAVLQEGFNIVYQPQIDVNTNQIVGLEALLRIKDSDISPNEFIPIAENNRLINKIGRIVIEKVIIQQEAWMKANKKIVTTYVNFSANQLQDHSINEYIKDLLEHHHIPADMLGIEVTESTIVDNRSATIQTLSEMKKLGIKTAIDDFGSGQAGINYMTNFKVDMVKFDKSFSDKYLTEKNLKIYHTLLKLTHDLGFITLAEGIETQEQIDLIKKTDCSIVQGYYYYKPQNPEFITTILLNIPNK